MQNVDLGKVRPLVLATTNAITMQYSGEEMVEKEMPHGDLSAGVERL